MITRIAGGQYRKGLAALERGDVDALLTQFDPDCILTFVGEGPLGAELSGRDDLRLWFERFLRLLPDRRFEIQKLVVSGPPWRMRLASHVVITSHIDGQPYRNQFAHFLTIRWGRVVDDFVLEDTQTWALGCDQLVAAGVTEATAGRLVGTPSSASA